MVQNGGPTYHPTNIDSVLGQYERIKSQTGGDFWTPKAGRNLIRILPPWAEGKLFWRETAVHWNVGPDSKMVVCLKKELDKPCYICEAYARLQQSQDPRDQSAASEIRANTRVYLNIVDLDNVDKGVQVYTCGIKILQDLLAYFADPDWGDITHPETGYDIVIEREGSTRENTKYQVRARKNPTAIPNMDLLSNLKNLDSFVKTTSYEQMQAIYEGMSAEDAADQFDGPTPASNRPGAKAQPGTTGTKASPQAAKPPVSVSPGKTQGTATKPPVQAVKPAVAAKPPTQTVVEEPASEEPPAIGDEVGAAVSEATSEMPTCYGKLLDTTDPACQHCAVQKGCDEIMNPKPKTPARQPMRQPASSQLASKLKAEG
jgi:hypothetical protein